MLQSFFSETTDSRSSSIKMPDSMVDWSEFLMNQLLRQNAQLSGRDIRVHFENENPEMRTATGTLSVRDDEDIKLMEVPFVIKEGQLSPLDVFYPAGGSDPLPLTENRTLEAMFRARSIGRIAPRPSRGAMTDDGFSTMSPYSHVGSMMGGTVFPYNTKQASLMERVKEAMASPPEAYLDKVAEEASKEDFDRLEKEASSYEGAVALRALLHHPPTREMLKLASMHAPHALPYAKIPEDGNDRFVAAHFSTQGANLFDAYTLNARGTLQKWAGLDELRVKAIAGQVLDKNDPDFIQSLYRVGERTLTHPKSMGREVMDTRLDDEVKVSWHPLPKGRSMKVQVYRSMSKTLLQGFYLGEVEGPDGKDDNYRLFSKMDIGFAYQPAIVGSILEGDLNAGFPPKLKAMEDIKEGALATLLMANEEVKEGAPRALSPFRIDGFKDCSWGNGFQWLEVTFLKDEKKARLLQSGNFIRPTKVVLKADREVLYEGEKPYSPAGYTERMPCYFVPRDAVLIDLGPMFEVAESVEDMQAKRTMEKAGQRLSRLRVFYTPEEDTYAWHPELSNLSREKIASAWGWDTHALSLPQFIAIAGMEGFSEKVAAKMAIFARDRLTLDTKVDAPSQLQPALTKHAEKRRAVAKEVEAVQAYLSRVPLLKIASGVRAGNSAANILGLRLFSDDTLRAFSARGGEVKKTLSFLCTLLLAKRLDEQLALEELDLTSAIQALDNVLDGLKKINGLLAMEEQAA